MKPTTSTITVRAYEQEDFETITKWAKARQVMVFEEMLPRMGGMAYDEESGDLLACAWLYMDNSVGVAFPHWLLANPANDMATSRDAISLLGEWLEYMAEDLNYNCFVTFFGPGAMTAEAEKNGYSVIGRGQNLCMKLLRK